jgi:predicted PurR-regulated permease PerM
MTKPNLAELIFLWTLFAITGFLAFGIMQPYFSALFLAAVFAVLFSSWYRHALKVLRGKETYAALLTVLLVLCLILLPLMLLGVLLFQEVFTIYGMLTGEGTLISAFNKITDAITQYMRTFIPSFTIDVDITAYAKSALTWIAIHLNTFFTEILSFMFQILLIIIAMFFFLRDGEKLHAFAVKLSPLADTYDEGIIMKLELAIASIIKGTLVTAVVQGVLVGLGFTIFGIPNPVLWGSISVVASLIPVVGTSLITIPAGIGLLFAGHVGPGIGLLIWAFFVGSIDNFIRPFLIKRGVDVHPFLILLSVLGGLAYFGPVGFIAGPIVIAFFFVLLEIYPVIAKGHAVKEE